MVDRVGNNLFTDIEYFNLLKPTNMELPKPFCLDDKPQVWVTYAVRLRMVVFIILGETQNFV